MSTYTAFALDNTVPAGPHYGDDDDWAVVPGITVENAEGRTVTGKNLQWPAGKFNPDIADETLTGMGFRRTSPWTWHDWDWRASLVAAGPSTGEEQQP